ncbi:MAG: aminoacyl-tRNA hydrolase [Thermodesulfobacteriota bacterium]
MSSQKIRLLIGLGNPGDAYRETRHNAGFLVLDKVAETFSIVMGRKKFDVVMGRGLIGSHEVILAKPQAYMNRSGPPVLMLADYFKISSEEMLIVHDDIDLAFGRIKIKEHGGHGGHNGLRSLIEAFGSGNFVRLRVGIGRSEAFTVTDHVLGRFSADENAVLDQVIGKAGDAVVTILNKGIREGMNTFNQRKVIT